MKDFKITQPTSADSFAAVVCLPQRNATAGNRSMVPGRFLPGSFQFLEI